MLTVLLDRFQKYTLTDLRDLKIFFFFTLFYLSWTTLIVGFRTDHLTFYLFISICLLFSPLSRKIVYAFAAFILFWIIYDSMRIYPNYLFNEVLIQELYLWEKSIFGISENGNVYTLNEYFVIHSNRILDLLSGLFYLTWVPVPLALGLYLFYKDKNMLLKFSTVYLIANLIGFCLYYIFPAAPPWYYDKYGDVELFSIQGDPANLVKFDLLIGYPLFTDMYTKNANVFAAIPSLHAAYPVVTLYYAWRSGLKWVLLFLLIDVLGIWFAAVYSFHHYLIDVLLGFLCAVGAIIFFEAVLMRTKVKSWLEQYVHFIESDR